MKRFYMTLMLVLFVCAGASAEFKNGYYDKMNGKSGAALKAAAKECVRTHQTLVYSDLPTYWQYSDVYPELVDGCKRWWDMYSDAVYLIKEGRPARAVSRQNKMQREHSVPKSGGSRAARWNIRRLIPICGISFPPMAQQIKLS